jgi:hypothetical protein
VHSDGSGLWVPLVSPAGETSISGSGPADVFAASGAQILHYTGSCWSAPLAMAPASGYQSVWVASPNAVFAAGTVGALDRFDGAAWAHDTDGTDDWAGMWARSPSDAFAVGGGPGGTQIDHWDGSAWTRQTNPTASMLGAVTGTSSAEYAIGQNAITSTGGAWTTVGQVFPSVAEAAIWLADDGTIFVAGDQLYAIRGGTNQTLFQGATSWNALWGTSSSDVFAAGAGGQIRHFDGTTWSDPMDVPTTVELKGLWGTSDDDVFAVGATGTILHYHAQLWSAVPPPAGVNASFKSVAGAGSTIFIVGDGGTVVRLIESAP